MEDGGASYDQEVKKVLKDSVEFAEVAKESRLTINVLDAITCNIEMLNAIGQSAPNNPDADLGPNAALIVVKASRKLTEIALMISREHEHGGPRFATLVSSPFFRRCLPPWCC